MKYQMQEWLGRWDNFEAYINSSDPYLMRAWKEAETAAGAMPMFRCGVKAFWQQACRTISPENPVSLGGWEITPAENEKLCIEWFDAEEQSLGKAVYHLDSILSKGLEGKENAVFAAEGVPDDWAFRILLAMEPMPPRADLAKGGLLSHLHFQYASSLSLLMDSDTQKLLHPMWYATMCAGDGSLLDKCNIVRALHRLPCWTELPQQ